MIDKASRGISVIMKLSHQIPRHSLETLYKSFIRSILEYADVIYDQPSNISFSDQIESIQYNAALAITGAIKGTPRDSNIQQHTTLHIQQRILCILIFHKSCHQI